MSEAKKRTVTLKRTLSAPIKLVWEAWTQPEHIVHWWGPKGMDTKVIEHDFSVGGKWKYTMSMPDRNEFISEGVYSEIVELEKIFSSANFKPMTESVEIQAVFEANGDKTNFTFNVIHTTEEYCRQQEKMGIMNGWGSVFDRLEIFVSSSKGR
ncbi:SRPBCC domain-containing protein [Fulvivirga sp. M361]|uniref:SRPBCC domain-containing protein n=1 Tax=Fulvivirga sp. M361 TaxID=2594266 RepID=UPI001C87218A|nr:SRPBCC domain-containing protein [Fulvivirga sp. M361]